MQYGKVLDMDRYQEEGLYIVTENGKEIRMTWETIDKESERLLQEIAVSKNEDFKRILLTTCTICTLPNGLCYALRCILPFLTKIDEFRSYDKVTALFMGKDGVLHVSHTTMQNALQYISILSFIVYCKAGQKYASFFEGINPLMSTSRISRELFLRIYKHCKGDHGKMVEFIGKFQKDVDLLLGNLMERVKQVCKNDAIVNALHKMHIITGFLGMQLDSKGEDLVISKAYEKNRS